MFTILHELPVPSSSFTRGPTLIALPKRECELAFYIECDDGDRKAGLLFKGVEAYKCTHLPARTKAMIDAAYDRLVVIQSSAWLREIEESAALFYSSRHGPMPELQHYMICFDSGPCYEFICASFTTLD